MWRWRPVGLHLGEGPEAGLAVEAFMRGLSQRLGLGENNAGLRVRYGFFIVIVICSLQNVLKLRCFRSQLAHGQSKLYRVAVYAICVPVDVLPFFVKSGSLVVGYSGDTCAITSTISCRHYLELIRHLHMLNSVSSASQCNLNMMSTCESFFGSCPCLAV